MTDLREPTPIRWAELLEPDALYRLDEITTEVDRHPAIPGQALADEFGQQEILRLREVATGAQGDRFDLPGFHDGVLGSSTIGLPVLGAVVSDRVGTRRAA